MKDHVTVIPADGIIIVNGIALPCKFTSHINHLHAIQWHEGIGEKEINNNGCMSNIRIEDYETDVLPYVKIWQTTFDQMKLESETLEPPEKTSWWKSFLQKLS